MGTTKDKKKKGKWYDKLRNKYRLVFMNDETLEERLTFRLSRLNVFIALGTLTIVLIFLTSILIAFTPLREYIPGYTNVGLQKDLYRLQRKTDSIEIALLRKDQFIRNLKDVISGNIKAEVPVPKDSLRRYTDIKLSHSVEDSLLRTQIENQGKYSLYRSENSESGARKKYSLGNLLFFTPLKGIVTNTFDPAQRHYGVDVVSKQNEAIKSVLDGTVIFSDWTVETGYVIAIQHQQNLVSVYKHNSALLKKQGEMVKAGEAIAIVGESGELKTGPHLHFELWSEGNPLDPKEYITF
jgi:murein DD-endopeptidase MepM/ murein hydrolase activator NlpD